MIPIEYDIIIFRENKTYIAYCPELDVSSCGVSIEQAKENLKTAVRLFIEEAEKLGTLEDILIESGYKKRRLWQMAITEDYSYRSSYRSVNICQE